ncbi:MAG: hypothetical protein IT324_08440 [Anaerolineae bacterium]|nr:hypothetical protein [Anaerolineae bacterium]
MPDSVITVRTLATHDDYHCAEAVQREIWGMQDPTQVIPLHVLLTAQKNGGLVAGAFDGSGDMIGILFGFIGLTSAGKFKHCSHIAGVLPGIRRQNIGQALKLFQRDYVMQQGLDLVTWTFDPLESVNASLNIGKLGAITNHYYRNMYGSSMADGLNSGLPTDRFEVEWWITSERVRAFVDQKRVRPDHHALLEQGAVQVNAARQESDGVIHPLDARFDRESDILLIEVPPEFQAIKAVSLDLARNWRALTADLFIHYFDHGYTVVDFVSDSSGDRRRNFYVLARRVEGIA